MAKQGKYKPETVKKIIQSILDGNFRCVAAKASGISQKTLCEWLHKYPDFKQKIEEAEAVSETLHVKNIVFASDKDPKWSAWWLERRAQERWNIGVYRHEFINLQKQLKELRKIVHELTEPQETNIEGKEGNSGNEVEEDNNPEDSD